MNRIEVIQQTALLRSAESSTVGIFGKKFDPLPETQSTCMIVHEDFPMLNENDLEEFIVYSKMIKKVVISGRRANIHPYRLMYIDDKGYDAFCANIPQEIRGNRHLYPEIYQFVPALISIPPNLNLNSALDFRKLDMFVLTEEKLLDQSVLTERLLIKALRG